MTTVLTDESARAIARIIFNAQRRRLAAEQAASSTAGADDDG